MLSRLRKNFGTAGLIVAVVALVAAVGGSAVAATDATDSAKKRNSKAKKKSKGVTVAQVRKISKQEARKLVGTGPQGPQGVPGLPGPQGLPGANGSDGQNGANGSDGDDGATGATGATGEEGSPWTAGGTLPSGATLTGAWATDPSPLLGPPGEAPSIRNVPLSLPIQLPAPIEFGNTHIVPKEGPVPAGCTGGTVAAPKADPGHFCVYVGRAVEGVPAEETPYMTVIRPSAEGTGGADPSGAVLQIITLEELGYGWGSWAVTAP
jgi:hypothetical protein